MLSLWPYCFKTCLLVLKDVLGRISRQPSALESHADRLYDTILASLDTLAGCTLTPNSTPTAHRSTSVKGISLVSGATPEEKICPETPVLDSGTEFCSNSWLFLRSFLN